MFDSTFKQAIATLALLIATGDGREPYLTERMHIDDEKKRSVQFTAMTFVGAATSNAPCRVVLLRGCSGSGKSTLAAQLAATLGTVVDMSTLSAEQCMGPLTKPAPDAPTCLVIAADDYPGLYVDDKIDTTQLPVAHRWAQKKAVEALEMGFSHAFVTNTFCHYWEMSNWFKIGRDFGGRVGVLELNTDKELRKSVHGVPVAKIDEMYTDIMINPITPYTAETIVALGLREGASFPEIKKANQLPAYYGLFPIGELPTVVNAVLNDGDVGGAPEQVKLEFTVGEPHLTSAFIGGLPNPAKKQELAKVAPQFGTQAKVTFTGVHLYDNPNGDHVTCLVVDKIEPVGGKLPAVTNPNPHMTVRFGGTLKAVDSNRTYVDYIAPEPEVKKGKKGKKDKKGNDDGGDDAAPAPAPVQGPLEGVKRYTLVEPLEVMMTFRAPLPYPFGK